MSAQANVVAMVGVLTMAMADAHARFVVVIAAAWGALRQPVIATRITILTAHRRHRLIHLHHRVLPQHLHRCLLRTLHRHPTVHLHRLRHHPHHRHLCRPCPHRHHPLGGATSTAPPVQTTLQLAANNAFPVSMALNRNREQNCALARHAHPARSSGSTTRQAAFAARPESTAASRGC
jgi:hypothetical protein